MNIIRSSRLFFIHSIIAIAVSVAAIPRTIAYQGILTDSAGNPVADGKHNVEFSLYDKSTVGASVWGGESHEVVTSKGLFAVLLGSKTTLSVPFDKPYWIEIKFNSKVLAPKIPLTAGAYAFRADTAEVAKKVTGLDGLLAGKAAAGHMHSVLVKKNGNDTAIIVDSAGRVGIGTKTPATRIHLIDSTDGLPSVILDNSKNENRGTGILFRKNGKNLGILGSDGLIRGDTTSNIGLFAETGKGIRIYTDGSANQKAEIYPNGNFRVNNTLSIDSGSSQRHNTVEIHPAPAGGTCKIHAGYWQTEGDLVIGTNSHKDDQLYLSKSGNVGIGTEDPKSTLDVAGTINAQSVKASSFITDFFYIQGGDTDWYLLAEVSGRHAIIEYVFSQATAHNPSISNGKLQFINAVSHMIQYHQTMGYNAYNQLQFALVNNGDVSQIWVRGSDTQQINGIFKILRSEFATLKLGSQKLSTLSGNTVTIYPKLPDNTHFFVGNVNVCGEIKASGNISTDANLCSASDRRYKTNVIAIDSSLSKISQINGIYYNWDTKNFPEKNFSKEKQIGLIAQDVEKVLPELVHTDSEGYKSLSYDKLTAVLVEAVKELKEENAKLRARVEALERR